jgi:4-hydroxy-3-polyprenylbenzoate decarboxylase
VKVAIVNNTKNFVVAVTGASGACYAARMIRFLAGRDGDIKLIFSEPAKLVWKEELNIDLESGRSPKKTLQEKLGIDGERLSVWDNSDFTAPISSGSNSHTAIIVIPCSMGTLGRIASGISGNLIERAADVALKEGWKLILVPRETPLNRIHLKNMLAVQEAGGIILPAMPAYYHHPRSLDELVDFLVGKVIDQLGIDHNLYRRWKE